MSSARRTQEDLRRILGYQDTQGGLQPPESRLRIDAGRGVFVIGTGETKSGAGNGAVDDEGDPIDPVVPPEGDANQNEDGSGTGDSSTDPALPPEIEVIDPEDSNYDVGDDLFGGNWGSGGAIGFVDCVEDTCIEIVPRGGFIDPPNFGESWQPEFFNPDDFASNTDGSQFAPPGKVWYRNGVYFPTALDAVPSNRSFSDYNWDGNRYVRTLSDVIQLLDCPSFGVEYCDSDFDYSQYAPTKWPSDNCIQLAPNESGQWAASEFENPNDLTPKYSNPRSTLDLCTPSGDGVQILPAADGGSVFWNYSQGSFMAISPNGFRSFGGSSALKGVVAGAVYGGGAGPKAVGDPTPS
jgi:hypothetical protein